MRKWVGTCPGGRCGHMSDSGITPKLIELQLATRANSRADTEIVLVPLREHLRWSFEASTKFAEQAIRSGFILNGGALVLFSGFAAFFKINPANVVRELVLAALAFVFGLTLSCLTCFLAFRSSKSEANFATHRMAATTLTHLHDPKALLKDNALINAQNDAAETWRRRAARETKLAVSVGICSLLAFIGGALIAGWTLMAHAGGT
jgi:hypothetical protein